MSALSIQPVYPIFTDIDGQPLENGYVWIGTANLDPQTNPINVYWDAALTILAPQPIRTLAGYPANSGTPARLYVNSDYSTRVMNKNGSVVYSAPVATERYGNLITAQDIVFRPPGSSTDTTIYTQITREIYIDNYGATPGSEASATANAAAISLAYQAASTTGASKIKFATGGVYWLPSQTPIAQAGMTLDLNGATLKQVSGSQTANWLIVSQCVGFSLINGTIDGNRTGAASLHPDSSLVTVFNTSDVTIDNVTFHASSAKGLAIASGVSGAGVKRVRVSNCTAYDCAVQCMLTDRSNGVGDDSIPCEDITFDKIFVYDTDHAGIAVNDGSRRVTVSNCILDVNNSTWDALAIRGARQVTVVNTIGRRGRNGCQVLLLDAAALARGEDPRDIVFSGNIWEENDQSGLAIVGAENVSVVGDIGKNNGQVSGGTGFTIIQTSGVRRAKAITLSSVIAIDDQAVPTQDTAILVAAADDVRITTPVMYGNIIDNRVKFLSGVTKFSVSNDGDDGATHKRLSAATGSIPAGGNVVVSLIFTTPFDVAPNWAQASALQASTTSPFLRIEKITALTTSVVQVQVSNSHVSAGSGTVYAEAACLV
jgi:hypothetical protein